MSSSIPRNTAKPNGEPPVFKEGLIIGLWSLVIMLVVMNTTMFNVALPQVAADFTLKATAAAWVVTGYSIVFAVASITYSRMSDFLPIRTLIGIGLSCLGAASVLGLFSHIFPLLLTARLLQAAGAAAGPGLGIVLVTRYVPLERRGRSMSTIISAGSLGFGLGPVVGGAVTQYLGWNWLFAVTALVLPVAPLLLRLLPREERRIVLFDLPGAVLVGVGTTGLLLFLTLHSLAAFGLGVLTLAAFAIRIRMAQHPFVQPALFGNLRYMMLNVMGFAAYVANFSLLFLMPMMLVHLFGTSSAGAGLLLFPGAALSAIVSNRIGKLIDRYGNLLLIRWGYPLLILGAVLFALLGRLSPYAVMGVYMLISISVTALTTSVSNEMSSILPREQIGAGMGLAQLTQFFGGAFGVAMTGSALVWQKTLAPAQAFTNIYWGIAFFVALSAVCYTAYRMKSRVIAQPAL